MRKREQACLKQKFLECCIRHDESLLPILTISRRFGAEIAKILPIWRRRTASVKMVDIYNSSEVSVDWHPPWWTSCFQSSTGLTTCCVTILTQSSFSVWGVVDRGFFSKNSKERPSCKKQRSALYAVVVPSDGIVETSSTQQSADLSCCETALERKDSISPKYQFDSPNSVG